MGRHKWRKSRWDAEGGGSLERKDRLSPWVTAGKPERPREIPREEG